MAYKKLGLNETKLGYDQIQHYYENFIFSKMLYGYA